MFRARSLAWRTDLMLRAFHGTVTQLPDCVRVETPSDPDFYSGNLLLFPSPPGPGDDLRWVRRFHEEFAHAPRIRHVTLGWDDPHGGPGVEEPFLAKGFTLIADVVLTAEAVQPPPRPLAGLDVRPLAGDADWAAAMENHRAERPPSVPPESYEPFIHRHLNRYREMTRTGRGTWFGAFLEGRLVGDLGIFVDEGVARFQEVGTHPEFRNRGVCGTLVHEASRHALARLGARVLVLVAEEGGPAERIYRSVGFRETERQRTLTLRPVA
ncbi:GNAT family N-acetyltransferase [Myxococcus sp. RHSTA-1-4]|uniref:GNAT family N-acetyltransferase n=1 Tax=Myxococcus sp. RHSTA-1-4 TaxID=2874601 RepID=UPI001CBEE4C2|nr:GNAT family N-acetyltransferase [Myxococcus sp. RHSTA-1-4]MBZ4416673.1 GNAT family N-acetyltransferase [Myxococcus sp. RHSTA-1-4]